MVSESRQYSHVVMEVGFQEKVSFNVFLHQKDCQIRFFFYSKPLNPKKYIELTNF